MSMVEASDSPAARLSDVTKWQRISASDERTGIAELEELFRRYERQLGQFLAQVVSDRSLADDLTQETFVAAIEERERLASVQNTEAWLFRIARNRALHALRTRRRALHALQRLARERHPDGREPTGTVDPADAAEVRDHLARHLKPDERALLVLRYVHGFRSHELAEIVGRSPDAIRQELSRTRRKLIKSLDDRPEGASPKSAHKE
jgi:RNA polymerase sigma-70 factor, ECF subfamily